MYLIRLTTYSPYIIVIWGKCTQHYPSKCQRTHNSPTPSAVSTSLDSKIRSFLLLSDLSHEIYTRVLGGPWQDWGDSSWEFLASMRSFERPRPSAGHCPTTPGFRLLLWPSQVNIVMPVLEMKNWGFIKFSNLFKVCTELIRGRTEICTQDCLTAMPVLFPPTMLLVTGISHCPQPAGEWNTFSQLSPASLSRKQSDCPF